MQNPDCGICEATAEEYKRKIKDMQAEIIALDNAIADLEGR